MIKYRSRFNCIEEIEVKGETAKFVIFMSGQKESKMSEYRCYFDTWEEVHAHLIEKAENDIRKRRAGLAVAQAYKEKLEAMRKP